MVAAPVPVVGGGGGGRCSGGSPMASGSCDGIPPPAARLQLLRSESPLESGGKGLRAGARGSAPSEPCWPPVPLLEAMMGRGSIPRPGGELRRAAEAPRASAGSGALEGAPRPAPPTPSGAPSGRSGRVAV